MVKINLEKYILRNREKLMQWVSLETLAKGHSKKYNCVPLLVVDALSILRPVFKDLREPYCGGQWTEYVRRLKNFVDSARAIGVELVFYFDGSFKEMTPEEVESREKSDGKRMSMMFESLRKGAVPRLVRPLQSGEPHFFRYVLKYECNCAVHMALTNLRKEVALFASQSRECFGILANDTDYIIFDTKHLFFAKYLDLSSMTTSLFLRKEFFVLTGWSWEYTSLFACAIGNDKVSTQLLSNLHRKISPKYKSEDGFLVDKILALFKQYGWPSTLCRYSFTDIAKIMEIDDKILQAGIEYYDLSKSLSDLEIASCSSLYTLRALRSKCFHCEIPSSLYTLLGCRMARYGISVEDPFDASMPPSAIIFKPIRHRMYSIMFEGQSIEVKEWCVLKNKNFLEPEIVTCSKLDIDGDIPSQGELLTGAVDPEIRWKLFIYCLGITIPREELATIDSHFLAMCCVLNVLLHCEQLRLEEWEVRSFICQAVFPHAKDIDQVSKLEVEINPRAASLLGILLRGLSILLKVLAVCGLPFPLQKAMPWKCIEGKVFHFCYNIFKESPDLFTVVEDLCDNKAEAIHAFYNMYRVVTMGTVLE